MEKSSFVLSDATRARTLVWPAGGHNPVSWRFMKSVGRNGSLHHGKRIGYRRPDYRDAMRMRRRNFAIVLLALATGGCANVHWDGPDANGDYTLTVPADTASPDDLMTRRANRLADKLCPHGWTKVLEEGFPDVEWTIACESAAGSTKGALPSADAPPAITGAPEPDAPSWTPPAIPAVPTPDPVVVPPATNVPPAPDAATAPPTKL
jgi:hypothetical protein